MPRILFIALSMRKAILAVKRSDIAFAPLVTAGCLCAGPVSRRVDPP